MTCRQVVRLLRDLHETCEDLEIGTDAVLPVAGCDPGTLTNFPRLADEGVRGAVVAKTGTLTTTDGGVAVLAGYARTENGLLMFCVASPRVGREVRRAREAQQRWLLDLIDRQGGPRPAECGPPVVFSDDTAVVELSRTSPIR
jgi:D-alanyl-D-alanine carboxypeptidase